MVLIQSGNPVAQWCDHNKSDFARQDLLLPYPHLHPHPQSHLHTFDTLCEIK